MKKLIALAAALGLAVSSWGLTPQQAPEAQAAPDSSTSVVLDAHVGRGLASASWSYVDRWGFGRHVTQESYALVITNVMTAIGAVIGAVGGTAFGPGGTLLGAGIGAGLGAL